jgi:hypothetical protein
MSYIKSFYLYLCFLIPVLLPNSLNACAVCFGAPDDPMTQGMRWGIATLLFILIPVLGGVGGFFYIFIPTWPGACRICSFARSRFVY